MKKTWKRKSTYRLLLFILICINLVGIFVYSYIKLDKTIPDNIRILVGEKENFNFKLPISADFVEDNVGVLQIDNKMVSANEIKLDLNKPFTLHSSNTGNYKINLKLFGFLSFKQIELGVIDTLEVIPSGNSIGIYIETDGVMVLGTGVVTGADGLNYEPSLNKLKSGDYILAINQKQVHSKEEVMEEIGRMNAKDNQDGKLNIRIRRNKEELDYMIEPVKTASGEYKIGAWIRDNTQGIGTLTFITTDGKFGALGHGITDVDTSLIMEMEEGSIYKADIMTIVKGKKGTPGELIGAISQNEKFRLGSIKKNTELGIYGEVKTDVLDTISAPIPIGLKQEVEYGPATILSCVDNTVKEYNILIEKIDINSSSLNKGMVIHIVDNELIEKTGGIVQGMSGSPIIQNGKIIGAVTHVFIQDSTKGYGTFIENMIYTLEK